MCSSDLRIAVAIPFEEVIGDLNQDGAFNVADLVLMQKYILGVETFNKEQAKIADMNGDGNIDPFDLVSYRKAIIKK